MPRHQRESLLNPDQPEILRLQLQVRGDVADLIRKIASHTGQEPAEVAKRLIGVAARRDWDQLNRREA